MGSLLLITIQVDMHDKLAMQLQDDVTQRISEWGSTGVLIDISSLEIVDSFIGRMLANIAPCPECWGRWGYSADTPAPLRECVSWSVFLARSSSGNIL
jgi:hypothetical protein